MTTTETLPVVGERFTTSAKYPYPLAVVPGIGCNYAIWNGDTFFVAIVGHVSAPVNAPTDAGKVLHVTSFSDDWSERGKFDSIRSQIEAWASIMGWLTAHTTAELACELLG